MPDIFSREKRSRIMSGISGKNTKPELIVRKLLHKMGFRYRLHVSSLPGRPDIVLPRHKKIIFVNGCFWHGHSECKRSSRPHTNVDFWNKKIDGNITRDKRVRKELERLGWKILVIWQCQTKDLDNLKQTILDYLEYKYK